MAKMDDKIRHLQVRQALTTTTSDKAFIDTVGEAARTHYDKSRADRRLRERINRAWTGRSWSVYTEMQKPARAWLQRLCVLKGVWRGR